MVELQANGATATATSASGAMVVGLSPLSETLWRDSKAMPGAGAAALIGEVSARLTWKDLSVTVALGPGKMQTVLDELTGFAEPGSLTALMGPSGSGKSTLLDALAGRLAANAFLSGSVLLNGRKAKLSFGAAAFPVCLGLGKSGTEALPDREVFRMVLKELSASSAAG